VDARVIARTTHDLEGACREGRFRWDLLFRLTAWVAEVPPLRARREDIRPLALHLVRSAAERQRRTAEGLTAEAIALLEAWAWPDNLVELRNTVDRAVATARGTVLTADELPGRLRVPVDAVRQRVARTEAEDSAADDRTRHDLRSRVEAYEDALIRTALEANAGDADRAAALLRVSPEQVRKGRGTLGSTPTSDPSPPSSDVPDDFRQRVDRFEKRLLQEALVRARGQLGEAANALGVQRRTLSQKVARYGLGRFVAAKE
jgi:DNA-binding NtrC family response regulator